METLKILQEQFEQNERLDYLENNVGQGTEARLRAIEAEQIVQNDDIAKLKGTVTYIGSINALTDPNNETLTKQELDNYVNIAKNRPSQEGDVIMALDTGYEWLCTTDAQGNTKWVVWNAGTKKIATRTEAGIVRVGNTLTIDANGRLDYDRSSRWTITNAARIEERDQFDIFDVSDGLRYMVPIGELLKAHMGTNIVATGTVLPYAGRIIPRGYLLCDGSEMPIDQYGDLYDVIGDIYGTATKTNYFKLPNLSGRFIAGRDYTNTDADFVMGTAGGEKTHTLTTDEMPAHTHTFTSTPHTHAFTGAAHTHTIASAGSHTHDVIMKYNSSWWNINNGSGSVNLDSIMTNNNLTVPSGATLTSRAYSGFVGTSGAHTHTLGSASSTGTNSDTTVTGTNATVGGGTAHNNLPPYLAMHYIIKY